MKEQMNLENLNKKEIKSPYELVLDTAKKIVAKTPSGKNKKEYLREMLNKDYGENLTKEIVENLPEEFFIENEEKPAKSVNEKEVYKIWNRIKLLPENEQAEKLEQILMDEYHISLEKIKELKKNPNWKKILKNIGKYASPAIGIATLLLILKSYNIDIKN